MANSSQNSSDLDYADKLWQAADKLRGTIDAAEYKHVVLGLLFLKVVLGLLFLKYVSDSFESRRAKLKAANEHDRATRQEIEPFVRLLERAIWHGDGYRDGKVFKTYGTVYVSDRYTPRQGA